MALKATKLRIGNFIHRSDLGDGHKRTETVLAIYERVKCSGPIPTICNFDDIEPIPLNPEWLVRFGFRRENNAWNAPIESVDFSIWNPKGDTEFTLNDTVIYPKIQYVHQLQNLYFALTSEELKLQDD